jgi:hypothetical protein
MWNNLHKPLDSGGVDMKSFKILICTYNCKSFKQGLNSWTFIQENILKLPDLLSLLCRSAHEDSNKICFVFFRGSYYLFMNCGSLIESFKIKQIGRKIEKPATGPIQPTGWHHAGCAACLGGRWASLETNKRSVPMAAGYTGERRQRKKNRKLPGDAALRGAEPGRRPPRWRGVTPGELVATAPVSGAAPRRKGAAVFTGCGGRRGTLVGGEDEGEAVIRQGSRSVEAEMRPGCARECCGMI